jgi:hypothetical protein
VLPGGERVAAGSDAATWCPARLRHGLNRLGSHLFAPIDGASIAVFRMLFGAIMVWEVWRYFAYGWIGTHFVEPEFFFSYPGFRWVKPWPGNGMYWHFAALGVLAVLIAAGLLYRVAMALFFAGFVYIFLIDQARYLNHFYLVALMAFLMVLAPAARVWSVDALLARGRRQAQIPAWSLFILCAQVEIMYLYAGLMKIDRDWLQLEPLRQWLAGNAELPLIGPLLLNDAVVAAAAYGTIALHLLGAPLLLFRATRLWIFLAYCVFHGLNALFWNIGIFPWFIIAATLLFFPPDWPRRLLERLRGPATVLMQPLPQAAAPSPAMRGAVTAFVGAWIVLQLAIPLRFLAYPGYVSWHEQGHRFSWRMMLRDKEGVAVFSIRDPQTGGSWLADPSYSLTEKQHRTMVGRPELLRLFAHHLERVWAEEHGTPNVEVRALSAVSLNGRPARPLVDPNRDLTEVAFSLRPADWIVDLGDETLPPREQRWLDDFDAVLERLIAEHHLGCEHRGLPSKMKALMQCARARAPGAPCCAAPRARGRRSGPRRGGGTARSSPG